MVALTVLMWTVLIVYFFVAIMGAYCPGLGHSVTRSVVFSLLFVSFLPGYSRVCVIFVFYKNPGLPTKF